MDRSGNKMSDLFENNKLLYCKEYQNAVSDVTHTLNCHLYPSIDLYPSFRYNTIHCEH